MRFAWRHIARIAGCGVISAEIAVDLSRCRRPRFHTAIPAKAGIPLSGNRTTPRLGPGFCRGDGIGCSRVAQWGRGERSEPHHHERSVAMTIGNVSCVSMPMKHMPQCVVGFAALTATLRITPPYVLHRPRCNAARQGTHRRQPRPRPETVAAATVPRLPPRARRRRAEVGRVLTRHRDASVAVRGDRNPCDACGETRPRVACGGNAKSIRGGR